MPTDKDISELNQQEIDKRISAAKSVLRRQLDAFSGRASKAQNASYQMLERFIVQNDDSELWLQIYEHQKSDQELDRWEKKQKFDREDIDIECFRKQYEKYRGGENILTKTFKENGIDKESNITIDRIVKSLNSLLNLRDLYLRINGIDEAGAAEIFLFNSFMMYQYMIAYKLGELTKNQVRQMNRRIVTYLFQGTLTGGDAENAAEAFYFSTASKIDAFLRKYPLLTDLLIPSRQGNRVSLDDSVYSCMACGTEVSKRDVFPHDVKFSKDKRGHYRISYKSDVKWDNPINSICPNCESSDFRPILKLNHNVYEYSQYDDLKQVLQKLCIGDFDEISQNKIQRYIQLYEDSKLFDLKDIDENAYLQECPTKYEGLNKFIEKENARGILHLFNRMIQEPNLYFMIPPDDVGMRIKDVLYKGKILFNDNIDFNSGLTLESRQLIEIMKKYENPEGFNPQKLFRLNRSLLRHVFPKTLKRTFIRLSDIKEKRGKLISRMQRAVYFTEHVSVSQNAERDLQWYVWRKQKGLSIIQIVEKTFNEMKDVVENYVFERIKKQISTIEEFTEHDLQYTILRKEDYEKLGKYTDVSRIKTKEDILEVLNSIIQKDISKKLELMNSLRILDVVRNADYIRRQRETSDIYKTRYKQLADDFKDDENVRVMINKAINRLERRIGTSSH